MIVSIIEDRFTTSDLINEGSSALTDDTGLTISEWRNIYAYNRWLRNERKSQKEGLEKSRGLFEKLKKVEEYESFKLYYFDALDNATTKKEFFDLFMERTQFIWNHLEL